MNSSPNYLLTSAIQRPAVFFSLRRSGLGFACASLAAVLLAHSATAQAPAEPPAQRLPTVVVEAEAEAEDVVQGPFLPDVQGARINSGKKTSVIDLDEFPVVINNNYRQALAKTPGLLLSEETTPLISVGYRGLPPHRAQFIQVLKDGIPIHADQFGYPEAYYTPPLDTVDRIEFIRGGAALMFGPQPGGALNYVTHMPRTDVPFGFGTKHTFGSDNFYSTFNYIDGTSGPFGYYSYYHHRQTDGFRTFNSDVDLHTGSIKLVLDTAPDSRLILTFDGYAEEHGEPGGLTFATRPDTVNYNANRDAASRRFDRFNLERYFGTLSWDKEVGPDTLFSLKSWGGYYSRLSRRQRGGGFGVLPTGPDAQTNTIEHQEFYTAAVEGRLRHEYEALGGYHTVAGGLQVYHTDSPREDRRGQSPDATGGVLRAKSQREVWYVPVFVENRFAWGSFSITPGVRLENIWQSVEEKRNVDKEAAGIPLGDQEDYEFVPLFGVGLKYEFIPRVEAYANVSQAYRPKIFTEAVPTGGTAIVPRDLDPGFIWQYDIGFRGNPEPYLTWDTSLFLLDFDDRVGTVALPGGRSTVQNVGRSRHIGWEAALELDLIGLADRLQGQPISAAVGKDAVPPNRGLVDRVGSFSIYGSITLLDAEFVSGPLEGNTPQYAPDYILRTGVIYSWRQLFKLALMGTFVDDQFADDNNTSERFIPAYGVWDLTLQAKLYKEFVSLHAGINNLFDEDYYSRVRDDGIDPAYGRNYYVGLGLTF